MKMSDPKRCPFCGELLPTDGICYCMQSENEYDYPENFDDDPGEDYFEDDYIEDELM